MSIKTNNVLLEEHKKTKRLFKGPDRETFKHPAQSETIGKREL